MSLMSAYVVSASSDPLNGYALPSFNLLLGGINTDILRRTRNTLTWSSIAPCFCFAFQLKVESRICGGVPFSTIQVVWLPSVGRIRVESRGTRWLARRCGGGNFGANGCLSITDSQAGYIRSTFEKSENGKQISCKIYQEASQLPMP